MAITGVCYCTRETVKTALDIKESARVNDQVDRALTGARDSVESLCNRKFYPQADTRFFDWPNFDRAYPWRLWLYADEVISVSALSSGGTVIPQNQYFLRAGRGYAGPPVTYIELDRSTAAACRAGATPPRSRSGARVVGYSAAPTPAGTLTAAMSDTTGTAATVSDSSKASPGAPGLSDS